MRKSGEIKDVKEVIECLESVSLIKYDRIEKTLSLHRLLQLVGREQSKNDKDKIFDELLTLFETFLDDKLIENPREGFELLENLKMQLITLKSHGSSFEKVEELLKQIKDQQFDYILNFLDNEYIDEQKIDLLMRQYLEIPEEDFNPLKMKLIGILECFTKISDRFDVISLCIEIKEEELEEIKTYFLKLKDEKILEKDPLNYFFYLCMTKKDEWITKEQYEKNRNVFFENLYDQIAFNESIFSDMGTDFILSGTKKGVEWFKRSAKRGSAFAQYNLGIFYEKGKGVKKSLKKAINWYEKAAKQGHASSKFNLGICYECGRGTQKDPDLAFSLYEEAAKLGHIRAQYNLSICYENGIGTAKNTTESLKWLRMSADSGNPKAQYNLAVKFEQEKKYKEALDLFERAAKKEKEAAYKAGMYYYEGKNVEKNFKKAFDYFSVGKNLGSDISQVNLGILYANGHGVDQSYKDAILLWESLSSNKYALYHLGRSLCYGVGIEKNYEKGIDLIKKSAESEYTEAQFLLGYI